MNWKNILSVAAAAFMGGAGNYVSASIEHGIPSSATAAKTIALGAMVAGLVAVWHLYQPKPGAALPSPPPAPPGAS